MFPANGLASLFWRSLVLRTVRPTLLIQLSIAVFRQSCYLQDYRNDRQEPCVVSRIFCKTIDTLVKSSTSSVLLFVRLSRRPVYCQPYFLQDYQYIRQDQCTIDTVCVVIDTVCVNSCRTIDVMLKNIFSIVLLFVGLLTCWSREECAIRGESHIDFRNQRSIMTFTGGGGRGEGYCYC